MYESRGPYEPRVAAGPSASVEPAPERDWIYIILYPKRHGRIKFAVSYFLFGDRTPFLQHAAIAASMAALGPLDSVADVDMVAVS